MKVPSDLRYTESHEWMRTESDGTVTIGITDHAQEQLGDIVFVELPASGKQLSKGDDAAVVESVKAASDVYAPVSGVVGDANPSLEQDPALVNTGAESDGWFFTIVLENRNELDGLMDEAAYRAFVESL